MEEGLTTASKDNTENDGEQEEIDSGRLTVAGDE